jgi:hypothetical protein
MAARPSDVRSAPDSGHSSAASYDEQRQPGLVKVEAKLDAVVVRRPDYAACASSSFDPQRAAEEVNLTSR